MDTSLKSYAEKTATKRESFLGYGGIGARFSVEQTADGLSIQESIGRQLFLIFSFFALGPGIELLFFLKKVELSRKPIFIFILILFFSIVC